jgi:hypothetical protein
MTAPVLRRPPKEFDGARYAPAVAAATRRAASETIETNDSGYSRSSPHHSAMNSAVAWVILRTDSKFTRSSKPWMSSDFGP